MLVLDAYLVGAPTFLSNGQRDPVCDWYRSKVSASAAGMTWQTIIPDLLSQGHDLDLNVTKEQVTGAAARWIVAVADTYAIPTLE